MKKIAVIIKSYGKEYLWGGAEYLCYYFVQNLSSLYEIDILTISSNPLNENTINIHIHRLDLDPCSNNSLKQYLEKNQNNYKVVFLMKRDIDVISQISNYSNICFVPFLHDTPSIEHPIVRKAITQSQAFVFNTAEEKELFLSHYNLSNKKYTIGLWALEPLTDSSYASSVQIPQSPYIVYVGRIANSKNYQELNEFFIRFKKEHTSNLKLVVIGKISQEMTLTYSDDIIYTGFIPESEKKALIKNARILVLPSIQESLSIVILESMQLGTPVLVNSTCPVLKRHCEKSNAGLYYKTPAEFSATLSYILNNNEMYDAMSKNGITYTNTFYTWNKVIPRLSTFINSVFDKNYVMSQPTSNQVSSISIESTIQNIRNEISHSIPTDYPTIYQLRKRHFLECLRQKQEIVIVGAGSNGLAIYNFLNNTSCNVVCFTDQKATNSSQLNNLPLITLEKATKQFPKAYYIITPEKYKHELAIKLLQLNIHNNNIDFGIPL